MADTLLRELTNTDLDWLITSGERKRFPAGHHLLKSQGQQDLIFIVIEGCLGLGLPVDNYGQSMGDFNAIDKLNSGEIVGAGELFGVPEKMTFQTLESSLIMSLPVARIQERMQEDIEFAAHFCRAIAVMLSGRLRRIFEYPDRIKFWEERSSKEALSVFRELRDSDLDWLVSFGETEIIGADKVLLQAGRPVDALYILLDGQMSISAPEGNFNPLYLCFAGLENSTREQKPFATLSKGGMPGIISFLDFCPLPITFRAARESLVYVVPRSTLVTKLQVDNGFAARFYRVIAIEILERLQTIGARLTHPDTLQTLAEEDGLDEELAMETLQHMSEGAKKFNWMLEQLGVASYG